MIDELIYKFLGALHNWQDCAHEYNCREWDEFAATFAELDRAIKDQPREGGA